VKPAQEINMAHFTQLNLQANSSSKSNASLPSGASGKTPSTSKPPKKHHSGAKIVAISGSLVAAVLVATLTLGTNGCSKSNKPAIATPSASIASIAQPAPTPMTSSAVTLTPATKPVKKISRQRTVLTYENADYGLSFRYPKTYNLKKDDKAMAESEEPGPADMNFVQPGGTTLAAVQLPDRMYRGTDFASASFNVSVNPKVTSEECTKFAFQDGQPVADTASEDDANAASTIKPAEMKLGAAEFTEVEISGGDKAKHTDAKYYHVFQNGACYEFALGLETSDAKANIKPVDQNAVFGKLNWMLSTVKITDAGLPAETAAVKSDTTPAAVTTPDATAAAGTAAVPPVPATTSAAVEGGKN
jgi:hypothetical protein